MESNTLKVGIFVPCMTDLFGVSTAQNMVKILENMGLQCQYASHLTSCGYHLYEAGDVTTATLLGGQLIEAFRDVKYVVTCGAGCAAHVRHNFPRLFAHSALYNEALQLADKCYEFSDFVVNVLKRTLPAPACRHKVVLLQPGRVLRDYGGHEAALTLLRSIQGIEIVGTAELDTSLFFASQHPKVASELLRQTVHNALQRQADLIVCTDHTILIQLEGYCSKQEIPLTCLHLVDLLAD